jgi:hypothetical protein
MWAVRALMILDMADAVAFWRDHVFRTLDA